MFEPLKDIVGGHAENLMEALNAVIVRLDAIVENTVSTVEYDEFHTQGKRGVSGVEKTVDIEFRPKQGLSWKVSRVGVTQAEKGNCAVYLNAIAPQNLVDLISGPISTDRPRYLVPRGSILIFHFYEQGENQACTANVQAEQFNAGITPRRSMKGKGTDGRIDIVRVPEPPSGDPLHEPEIV